MEFALLALVTVALGGGTALVRSRMAAAETGTAALTRPRMLPDRAPTGIDAREISHYDGLVDHPGYAVTPAGIMSAFREAERGYPARQCDMIDDLVENDGHLRNLLEQREQAVAGKPWVVQAGGVDVDDELAARVLGEALRRLPMLQVFQHLLTVNRYGWAAVEIDWGVVMIDGRPWIVPTWLAPVPARRFRISMSPASGGSVDELRLFADLSRPEGDPLRPGKWIVLRRAGTWIARAGLMRTAAWYAMAKRFGFRDWIIFSQRFGLPLVLSKYDAESDDGARDTAEEIVRKIGSDGGAVIPKEIEVELVEAVKGGTNEKTHGGLIAHCNAEMSKLVNGSTLANDNAGSGGASYALGEVHAGTRWDSIVFDAELLQEAIRTQLAAPFVAFNALRASAPLTKIQVVRDLDPKVRAEIAVRLKNQLGIDVSISQMRQELGFREPQGDADAAPGMRVDSFPAASGGQP